MAEPSLGLKLWTYRRRFSADGLPCAVHYRAGLRGTQSILMLCDVPHDQDYAPNFGEGGLRNHWLEAVLPSGKRLTVEAGYCSNFDVAIAADVEGIRIYESHPGTPIRLPEKTQRALAASRASPDHFAQHGIDFTALRNSRWAIAIDLALGLIFYVVALYAGLQTAAIMGAIAGIALVIAQRFVTVDIVGGLATFGIVMLLISAGLAWGFQDDYWVKQRSTIVGIIGAIAFLADGMFGGRWLGKGMSRYLVYNDVRPKRLAIGMGLTGLAMAALNAVVAQLASTKIWLFYHTFVDVIVAVALASLAIQFARSGKKGA
jgi:intracellular septation protein A